MNSFQTLHKQSESSVPIRKHSFYTKKESNSYKQIPTYTKLLTVSDWGGQLHQSSFDYNFSDITIDNIQAKLMVSHSNDPHEREADSVAEEVMRVQECVAGISITDEKVQRKCICSDMRDSMDECTKCRKKRLQRYAPDRAEPATVPPIVQEVLRSPGQTLAPETQSFMETRFGQNFSDVRVHTDTRGVESARMLGARAFTVGRDIVFGAGEYSPETTPGKRLLAHELAHVMQQRGSFSDVLLRSIMVEDPDNLLPGSPPKKNREEIADYIRVLCPSFTVTTSGKVEPSSGTFCTTITPTIRISCPCLCDLHNSTNPEPWKIKIDDNDWPHTEEADRRVIAHSTRSVVTFGAWGGETAAGRRISEDNPRVLGHELCGHAWLFERGTHPPFVAAAGGRPSHDVTVFIENLVALEIRGPGVDFRGMFSDPHHGESFARVTVSGFPRGSRDVSGLSLDMQARITKVHGFMHSTPIVMADIIGHASHTGSPSGRDSVSRQRAQNLKNKLVSLGIASSRFKAVIGKSDRECPPSPPAPPDDPDCRKVEIFMFPFEAASETFP